MCNQGLFGSVQHVFFFYVHEENTVQLRNTRLWHSLPSVQCYASEHTQNVKNVLQDVHRSRSFQKVIFIFIFFSPAVTCCEVLQPRLLH